MLSLGGPTLKKKKKRFVTMQDQTTKLPQLGNWETTGIKEGKETTKK